MTKDVLVERINKKELEIQKLEKKVAKWEENKTSEKYLIKEYGWIKNFNERKEDYTKQCIEYCEREKKSALNSLEEAKKTLNNYKNQLEVEIQKENSLDELPEMFNEFKESLINAWDEFDKAKRNKIKADMKEMSFRELKAKYGFGYSEKAMESDEHIHQENIKAAKNIILDLINRVSYKTGEITDFSGLRINANNQGFAVLNGIVFGKKGSAEVESILAGGYNIQRLHVRVLVK